MISEEERNLLAMIESEISATRGEDPKLKSTDVMELSRISRPDSDPWLAISSKSFHVAGQIAGRIVTLESGEDDPRITLTLNGEPEFCIDRLRIAKRAIHTLREGNRYFIRTNSEHGLLSLAITGAGVRLAFVDGTWLGDVAKEPFLTSLAVI